MTTALPVNQLIAISLNLIAAPLPVQNFNSALILGGSEVIDTVQRYRVYTTFTEVAQDFGSTTPEYLSAQAWFNQTPAPNILYIGRWVETDSTGQLTCGPLTVPNSDIATWNLITTGGFQITINGTPISIGPLNFATDGNLNAVATRIQNALIAALSGTHCVYDGVYNRFIIKSSTTGIGSTVSFLTAPLSGIDISTMLSGTAATGAYIANGQAAETALAAVQYFDINYPTLWFGLYVAGASPTDYLNIQAYIEGLQGAHFQAIPTQDPNVLLSGNTSNIAYTLKQDKYNWCFVFYSSTSLYAAVSALSRILTTNWTASQSAITLMYKQLPGITADNFTASQSAAAQGFNANVYVNYDVNGNFPIVQYGICPSGNYVDSVIGAAVLKATILTNLFNLLVSSSNKIPYTDSGMNILDNGIVKACEQFVKNGYLGPEVWDGPSFGNLANGQFVSKGYYIYQPPVASVPASQRGNRISVPFQVAAVLSGAVHTVNVLINVAP